MDNINTIDMLDPKRLSDLEYLRDTADNFDLSDYDADTEALYCYAQRLYLGTPETGEEKDKGMELFAKLFIYFYQNGELYSEWYDEEKEELICECNIGEGYKDIFLGAEFFTSNDVGPNEYLIEIAKIIQKGIPGVLEADPERAFNLVDHMPQVFGMLGGMELVESIRIQDFAKWFLGNCYMNGLGIKQNLGHALANYLFYRTDHLAQKWHESLITDEFDKLYIMFEEQDDAGLSKVELLSKYCALSVMTMEGIGCTPNLEKAMQYVLKAKEWNEKIHKNSPFGFEDLNGEFGFNFKYFCRLLSFNAKPYTEDMFLCKGEHVYLGKYNNRAVSWRVLDVSDGKALLLADEALESSYILGSRAMDRDWAQMGISYLVDIEEGLDSYLYDAEEGTGECFFLNEEMVNEYLPDPEDRICYYREQAYSNSMDGEEMNYNKLAEWWLLSEEDMENETRNFVGIDGEVYEGNYHHDFGIRPAMYVKVANGRKNG